MRWWAGVEGSLKEVCLSMWVFMRGGDIMNWRGYNDVRCVADRGMIGVLIISSCRSV